MSVSSAKVDWEVIWRSNCDRLCFVSPVVELINTHEVNEDGGVFVPSLKTQHVNPTVSTSFYEGGSFSGDQINATGDRRR